ncbi:MAG: hypothetical protein FJ087_21895, partial [Deltaproteobacteria bacterium]|nr:hypothetical protein [Deltaproteobacteria bacterium]
MKRIATSAVLATVALVAALGCGSGGGSSDPGAPPAKDECVEDTDCDDAVPCTEDVCGVSVGGVRRCTHVPRSERCGAGEECAIGTSAATSGCKPIAQGPCKGKADGAECDPGDRCATAKGFCNAGKCAAPLKQCPPENCRLSLGCDKATGECAYDVAEDGTACDGPSLCAPRCEGGLCKGSPISCDDADACTTDACDGQAGCTHSGGDCDDGNACTTDTCDKATGCSHTGGSCDDGDACTKDSCDPASGCGHAAVDCDDQNACTTDTCDKLTGCRNDYACDDGNPCTDDSCVPATGECVNANNTATCDDGDPCTGPADACADGVCGGPAIWGCCRTDADCSDGDPCTDESCGEDHACRRPGEPAGLCGAPAGCAFQACEPAAADPGLHACRDLVLSLPAQVIDGAPGDPGFVWTNETQTAFALPGRRVPAGVRVLHVRIPAPATCEAVTVTAAGAAPATTGCSLEPGAATAAFAWTEAAGGPLDVQVAIGGGTAATGVTLYAWAGAGCDPLGPVLVAGGSTYSDLAVAGSGGEVVVSFQRDLFAGMSGVGFSDLQFSPADVGPKFTGFVTSIVRRPDGQYLLAYGGADNRIGLVTLAPDGTKVAEEKLAVYDPVDDQFEPALIATAAGPRLFWTSSKADGQDSGIATALLPSGAPVAVNPTAAGRQHSPAVADGVVAWLSTGDGLNRVAARRLGGDGLPAGDEKVLVSSATVTYGRPTVAASMVAFQAKNDVRGKVLDATLQETGEFLLIADATTDYSSPVLLAGPGGPSLFVVRKA